MSWPDIFFKARKPPKKPELPPPFKPSSENTASNESPAKPGSRTFPGASGVVLRPMVRAIPQAPSPVAAPDVQQAMAEADPLRALRRTGSVRLTKRTEMEPKVKTEPVVTAVKSDPSTSVLPSIPPLFQPEAATPSTPGKEIQENVSPLILPPGNISTLTAQPPSSSSPARADSPPASFRFGTIFRRKAKMTDVARVVLPPKREELPSPEPSGAVVPPAFPVATATGNLIQVETLPKAPVTIEKPSEEKKPITVEVEPPASTSNLVVKDPPLEENVPPAEPVSVTSEPQIKSDDVQVPAPGTQENITADSPIPVAEENAPPPKTAPAEATPKPEPADTSIPLEPLSPPGGLPEKREFLLANGERILGKVLSETPEAIYIDHGTLGVLTLPRSQIAKRLIEIILINGDRIVGDVMAETPDTLYIRHASLGMLTVPRAQRSTRVVEAILKDGDRILGEVLGETESFTVIRSATLGTVAVPHNKVAMLNRKIEQIELKALPPSSPEIKDKSL